MKRAVVNRGGAATIVGGVALALTLTACGSGGSGGSDGSDITLTLTDTMSETSQRTYVPIYEACAAEIGVGIEANHVAGSGHIQTVLQQMSSRTLPDVLMLDNSDVQQIASSGALSDLGDYGITGEDFPEVVVEAGSYDGVYYGVAPVVNAVGLIYNEDLLAEAGIEPPTTWAELSDAAAELTADGRYGLAFSGAASLEGAVHYLPFLWSNGGTEDDLTSPEAVEALQFLTDLVQSGSASSSVVNWSQNDVNDQFIAGNAAMMINGPWNLPKLEAAEGLNYGVVPVPVPEAGDTSIAALGGETFTVPLNEDGDRMQKAGEFVACITSPENQLKMGLGRGAIPSSTSAAAEAAAEVPLIAGFVEPVANARPRTGLLGEDWPAAQTAIYTALQSALTGQLAPADALAQAAG